MIFFLYVPLRIPLFSMMNIYYISIKEKKNENQVDENNILIQTESSL